MDRDAAKDHVVTKPTDGNSGDFTDLFSVNF